MSSADHFADARRRGRSAIVRFFPGDTAGDVLDLSCGEPDGAVLVYGLPKQAPDERGGGNVLGGGPLAQLRVQFPVDAAHDFGAFYLVLCENGWSQHRIAKATKTQQSAISEIIKGRQVIDYRVLVRIAEGLGIPRELMHLDSGSADGAYADDVTVAETPEGVSAEMRRRLLLPAAG